MRDLLQKYLKILKIELEDLEEDLAMFLELHRQRKHRGEITNYVFWENTAFLKNEISGINNFLHTVNVLDVEKYNTMTDMIDDIDNIFRQRTKDYNFPEAVYMLVKRKLNKVSQYMLESEP